MSFMSFMNKLQRAGILKRSQTAQDVSEVIRWRAGIHDAQGLIPTREHHGRDVRALDAVYRALSILESTARQLSLDVWRGSELLDGEKRPSLATRPSLDLMSLGQFTAETVSSLAQDGNAYWRLHRAGDGYSVVDIEVIDPRRCNVTIGNDNKTRHYWLDGKEISRTDFLHLRLTHTPGEPYGQSPLKACISSLRSALDLRDYADNWTSLRGAPTGILTTEQDLSAEEADKYKARANKLMQYDQGISVLGKGLTYHRILLDPKELQFLESQQANVVMIARMFGIPARMMLASIEGGAETYANLESENSQFIKGTLMGYLAEIEDAFTLALPRGQRARYNLDAFLRPDTLTRYQAHEIGIRAGFLDPDEARAIEGRNPLPAPAKEKENAHA